LSDSKIVVLPADLVKKIDDNRGDMSRAEFIDALIENLVVDKTEPKSSPVYATKEEMAVFQQDMKQLLKSFLDFFMSYGMELGETGQQLDVDKFTSKLQGLQKDVAGDNGKGESGKGSGKATIRWKGL
jgi:metal-responsive CopG/Arc/MetJ family transcriptional regulator